MSGIKCYTLVVFLATASYSLFAENVVSPLHRFSLVVPSVEKIINAEKVVGELCKRDVDSLKKGEIDADEFAENMLAEIREIEEEDVRFVMRRLTFEKYAEKGEFKAAGAYYNSVLNKLGPEYANAIASSGVKIIRMRRYDKDKDVAKAANKALDQISFVSDQLDRIRSAKSKLAKSNDIKIKKDLARRYVLVGDWVSALEQFAGLNTPVSSVAKWELAFPDENDEKNTPISVGDYWWERSQNVSPKSFADALARHAMLWYKLAMNISDVPTIKKRLIESRLSSLEGNSDDGVDTIVDGDKPKIKWEKGAEVKILKTTEEGEGEMWSGVDGIGLVRSMGEFSMPGYKQLQLQEYRCAVVTGYERSRSMAAVGHSCWNSRELCLRKEVMIERGLESAVARYIIDDDVDVWINGRKVLEHRGYTRGSYVERNIDVSCFKKGKNVIALHAINPHAGGYVDFGLRVKCK